MPIIHLNINSFRNKFVFAEKIIQVFDTFLVLESKLDSAFPVTRFLCMTKINLFLYVNERVRCRLLQGHPNLKFTKAIEDGYFYVYTNHLTRMISSF